MVSDAAMLGHYDFLLVALSVLVAMSASYVAIDLAERVTATRGWIQKAWLAGGATAMGTGIWSMHFTGMLAFHLPVPVSYHWPTVLLSFLIGWLSSAASLHVVSKQKPNFARTAASGVAMGLGIATMHYTGMAAMRMAATTRFDAGIVTLSIFLAIANSLAGLWLAFRFRAEVRAIVWRKIGSGVVMGMAIWLMHYVGMAAAIFTPSSMYLDLSRTVTVSPLGTAGISVVSLFVLGLAVWSSSVDRQSYSATSELMLNVLIYTEGRKQAEEQARQKLEADYRALLDHSPYGILRSTPDGRLLAVNPALVRMLGYDSETELLRSNLPGDIYADPAEQDKNIELYSSTDVITDREVRWKRKDGRELQVRLNGRVIRDNTGGVASFEEIIEDITERKQLEDQARQSQKMATIGQFAGGIVHDFNNLLLVILGQCELLLEHIQSDRARVGEIHTVAERAQWLTAQLMIFAGREKLELQLIDVNAVLEELRELLEGLIGGDILLVMELDPGLGPVRSDRGLIQQVVMNLVANARDAMPGGGTLQITTKNVEIDEVPFPDHPEIPLGRYAVLTVTDSGTGMDAPTQARLFEPYFTTKEAGKGTGLGLAVVLNVVTQSRGYITVQSEVGRGSSFRVFLPAVDPTETSK